MTHPVESNLCSHFDRLYTAAQTASVEIGLQAQSNELNAVVIWISRARPIYQLASSIISLFIFSSKQLHIEGVLSSF